MLGVNSALSTRNKSILLNFGVLAALLLCAFAFADLKSGFFIVNHRFIWLKLVLSAVLPFAAAYFCILKTKNIRPLSAMLLLIQPAFVLFTVAYNRYYIHYLIDNLQNHYAYALLAFFAVYIAALAAAYRRIITPADFELFGRRFFAGYIFVFIFLFIRLYYSSRVDVSLGTVNLIPFAGEIRFALQTIRKPGVVVHTVGNVLFYTSFSLMLSELFGSRIKSRAGQLLLLIGLPFIVSLACEISQYAARRGDADIDDFILNTLGAVIGYFAAKYIKKLVSED